MSEIKIEGVVEGHSWTRRVLIGETPAVSKYICVNDNDKTAFSVMYHFNGCSPSINTANYEYAVYKIENPRPVSVYYGLT